MVLLWAVRLLLSILFLAALPIRFIRKLVIDYVNIDIICVVSVSCIQCLHGIFVRGAGLFARAEIMCLNLDF